MRDHIALLLMKASFRLMDKGGDLMRAMIEFLAMRVATGALELDRVPQIAKPYVEKVLEDIGMLDIVQGGGTINSKY